MPWSATLCRLCECGQEAVWIVFTCLCITDWLWYAGCKAIVSVLLSTVSGMAYLVQQPEASQALINALNERYIVLMNSDNVYSQRNKIALSKCALACNADLA